MTHASHWEHDTEGVCKQAPVDIKHNHCLDEGTVMSSWNSHYVFHLTNTQATNAQQQKTLC